MTSFQPVRREASRERGAALLIAVATLSVLFLAVMSGLAMLEGSRRVITQQLTYHGQAVNAAEAGLTEGLSWFRRQPVQPVMSFDPQLDLSQNPPVNDSDDPAVGIVRTYEVSKLGSVWGRYELSRSIVRDVSLARGEANAGTVWEIDSRGIVYLNLDGSKGYDEYPNRILRRATATTQIRRLSLVLPSNSAVSSERGDGISLDAQTRVYGGPTGIALSFPASTGTPTIDGEATGVQATSQVDPYAGGLEDVFDLSQQELASMADIHTNLMSDLPTELPAMTLIVFQGDATFTASRPLVGSGILVVFGDLLLESGSLSSYNGLIYVTGDYTQQSPSQVSGAVVAQGQVAIESAGDFSEIFYDPSILDQVRRQIGQYRFSRSPVLRTE